MADTKKTIEILFAGKDQVSSVFNEISKKTSDLNKNLNDVGGGLRDFGEPFLDGAKAVAAMNTAVVALGLAGLKASSDIETATNKMAASLGKPIKEAEKFGQVAKDVYSAGYGEDLASAFDAVTIAQKKFGDNASVDIQNVTQNALKLQKAFGIDYKESLSATNTLMKNFGITSDEAFGFLTKGLQDGIDGSDDFIQTINEYSTQFKAGGATASQFYSIIKSGYQDGINGTDRAADAFKEFRVRIQNGSKMTKEALAKIGLDNDALQKSLNTGEKSVTETFNLIIQRLNSIEDPSVRLQAGVGLLGTQFEDLGTEAALALSTTITKMKDFQGVVDSVNVTSFEQTLTTSWRTIITAVSDLTIWEDLKTKLGKIFSDITGNINAAFSRIDLDRLEKAFAKTWQTIQDIFIKADLDLTSVEGLENALNLAIDGMESLANVTTGVVEAFEPVFLTVKKLYEGFNELSPATKELIGNIVGFGVELGVIGGIVSVGGSLISGIGAFTTAMGLLAASPIWAIVVGGGAATLFLNWLRDLFPQIDKNTQAVYRFIDSLFKLSGVPDAETLKEIDEDFKNTLVANSLRSKSQKSFEKPLPDLTKPFIESVKNAPPVSFKVEAKPTDIDVKPKIEDRELARLQNDINETLLKEYKINVQAEIDKEKLQTDLIETGLKEDAKIKIAEIEANAREFETLTSGLGQSIQSTGATLSSITDTYAGLDAETTSMGQMANIWQEMVQERFARQRLIDEQVELVKDERKYLKSKKEQLEKGTDALIKVTADGLEPELEAFMFKILERIQLRAVESQADFLLGI